jgi:peptidyl-prolyl cis-trans isomerase B (cyclophilin B)
VLTKKLAALAAILLLSGLTACADDRPSADVEGSDEETTETSTPTTSTEGTSCEYVEDGAPPAREVELPSGETDLSGEIPATIETSAGDLGITLDADNAPCTVASFLSLAEQDYYDDTECHRLGAVPGFSMLQCGDPTATGTGGPGYTIPDEVTGEETYPAGTIAMANTGIPNSGGGQFFLVFGDTQLQPAYTVFGTLDDAAIEVLEGVAEAGTDNSEGQGVGRPNEKVTFEDVVVE